MQSACQDLRRRFDPETAWRPEAVGAGPCNETGKPCSWQCNDASEGHSPPPGSLGGASAVDSTREVSSM